MNRSLGDLLDPLANAVKGAGDAALDEAAGFGESYPQNQVGFALPLAQGVLSEQRAGFESTLEVVHAEVGGVGVGYVDGDEGNIGLFEDVGDARGDRLFDLEFKHQVNALGHELLGVADGDVGVELVIEDDQFHA
jgi:hypothetical protein